MRRRVFVAAATDGLAVYFETHGSVDSREGLHDLVGRFLDQGQEMSDMCRVFRELWAVGSRDETVAELLDNHSRGLGRRLSSHLKYPSSNTLTAGRLGALILVISEGYSIVAREQPMRQDEAKSLFTDLLIFAADAPD